LHVGKGLEGQATGSSSCNRLLPLLPFDLACEQIEKKNAFYLIVLLHCYNFEGIQQIHQCTQVSLFLAEFVFYFCYFLSSRQNITNKMLLCQSFHTKMRK
jgi:hypothetical protein